MELYWRDTMQVPPSEAEYLQMVSNKTGGLFRLILRLLRVMSPVEHVMAVNVDVISKVVDVMGLQFQILDDLKNICDEKVSATPTDPFLRCPCKPVSWFTCIVFGSGHKILTNTSPPFPSTDGKTKRFLRRPNRGQILLSNRTRNLERKES